MDIYAENNGGFQALEGTSPFEEGSQFQGEGYMLFRILFTSKFTVLPSNSIKPRYQIN